MRRVESEGQVGARVMLVGDVPSRVDTLWGRGLMGPPGSFLWNEDPRYPLGVLSKLGIRRSDCYVTHAVKYTPPAEAGIEGWWTEKRGHAKKLGLPYMEDGMCFGDEVMQGRAELLEEIARVQPEVVVAMGDLSLWALTGETSVSKWRGSEIEVLDTYGRSIFVVPTLHPLTVLKQYGEKVIVEHDLKTRVVAKLGRVDARKEPEWKFLFDASFQELMNALSQLMDRVKQSNEAWLAVDVETRFGRIACVGVAWSSTEALCVPLMHVYGSRYWAEEEEAELIDWLKLTFSHPNVRLVGQNFNYDRQYFEADPSFRWLLPCAFDTAIAQHLLWPGTPKDLARLASIYCPWYRYWKDEGKGIEGEGDELQWFEYCCRDCVATYTVMQAQRARMAK